MIQGSCCRSGNSSSCNFKPVPPRLFNVGLHLNPTHRFALKDKSTILTKQKRKEIRSSKSNSRSREETAIFTVYLFELPNPFSMVIKPKAAKLNRFNYSGTFGINMSQLGFRPYNHTKGLSLSAISRKLGVGVRWRIDKGHGEVWCSCESLSGRASIYFHI